MPGDPDPPSASTEPVLDDSHLIFAFAHDLRSHLRMVLTRIQLVQRAGGAVLSAQDRSLLEQAVRSGDDINSLVNAMVAYCDPDAEDGGMDLSILLKGILIDLKSSLADARAEVKVQNDLDAVVPGGLRRVLKELVTNACKFRDENRPLTIRIATEMKPGGTLEVAVSDNGLGVGLAYLEKIFVPFTRLNSRHLFPGHGLGLAICRRMMSRWKGTISAVARDGEGLTVRVTLPLEKTSS